MTGSSTQAFLEAPELEPRWLTERLSSLVRTRSVTGVDSERAMAELIAGMLEATGCELGLVESLPGRPSLAAVLPGIAERPRVILNGHTDTVPPDDLDLWSVDPFGGEVRDGKVWGRGSVDMKGSLVCQIACAHVLARLRDRMRGTLVLHFAVGEEVGERGTTSLLEDAFGGDLGVVTEPTNLRVARAMRGVAYYQVTIHGRSSHAGRAELGRNPVAGLGDLLPALARYERQIARTTHPLFPPLTCTPTIVRGGRAAERDPRCVHTRGGQTNAAWRDERRGARGVARGGGGGYRSGAGGSRSRSSRSTTCSSPARSLPILRW